jgi:two-component system sensor histidine kinase ChiS
VLAERKTVFVQNLDKAHLVSESSRYFHELLPVKSHVTIPLFLDYTPVGALMFYTLSHPMDIENDLIEKIETDVYSIAMILKAIRLYEKVYRDYRYIKKIHLNFQKEIELAQKIQHNLIPEKFPGMPGIKVECWYQPMEELGGDFFDYIIRREGDGVGFFISDVAGHGVPSALITTMMKSLLSTYRVHHHKPSILFNRINRNLFENNVSSFFVTAFYLFLDIHKKKIAYSSAGHNEMILYRRRRESMEKMKTRGKFLGIFQDIEWEEKTASLENQDRILLYTDGITEMMSSKGEEFGIDRLMNLLHLSRNLDTVSTKNFLIRNILNYENKTLNNDDKAFILIDIL